MRLRHYLLITGLTLLLVALGLIASPVTAAQSDGENSKPITLPATGENDACLACHQNPQFKVDLGNGDNFELFVSPDEFTHSVHGENGITCIQCHVGFEPAMGHGLKFGSRREATLRLNETCGQCHKTQADQEKDGAHAAAREVGKMEAAICTDCHTAHAVKRLKDPATGQILPETRAWIPTTCQKCHSAIYEKYRNSVHGAALTDENNPDVPTCIDCHGVHIIEDPRTAAFRLNSPQICAKCHTDPKRMDKYGLSTQVLNTYVADFHGTTVTIFEQTSPDAATNKPVCYDCHGIHDIIRVDDPQKGLAIKANILGKCQKCHPDASANFPDAWMSHYIPSPEKYPIVYYINLFYQFFIPAVLGPMGILVVMDFSRMMINRFRKRRPVKHPVEKVKMHEKPNQPKVSEKTAETEEVKIAETPIETEAAEKSAPVETPVETTITSAAESNEEAAKPESGNEAVTVEKPENAEAGQNLPSAEEPESPKSGDEETAMTKPAGASPNQTFVRFSLLQRLEHVIFLISFSTLGFTGLPQKFPLSPISLGIFNLFGGVEVVRQIHHTAAIVMMIVSLVHVLEVLYRVLVLHTPISMIPWINDLIHVYEDVLYYIGRRKHKAYYGRYSYAEKAEYLALIWGTVVMGLTGFMMWNPISTVRFLPGEAIPAAKAAHGGEALLAVLAIIIWHFYHVHVKTLNKSMFKGTLSREEMEHEHPAELALIESGKHAEPIPPAVLRKRQMIYAPIAIVILALFSYGFYYFIGYETTALTTIPQGETAPVFVPVTPTPAPSATPTQAAPASAALTWNDLAGPLFQQKCAACHGAAAIAGLNLSTYADALKGSSKGPVIVAKDSANSKLIQLQSAGGHPGQLTAEELAQIKTWIDAGALEK